MSGKVSKFVALSLATALIPCLASALDMPLNVVMEQVDPTNLGLVQNGATARTPGGWAIQVGAYTDRQVAEARLDHVAQIRSDDLIHAARAVIPLKWDESHTVYRARFTGLSRESATALCGALSRAGEICFVAQEEKTDADNAVVEPASETDTMAGKGIADGNAPAALIASDAAPLEALELPAPDLSVATADAPAPNQTKAPSPGRVIVAANDKAQFRGSAEQIGNDELSGMRGGFFTAAGAQFDFGASIKTLVDGQLALQTNLTWTPSGAAIQQLAGLGQAIQSQVQSSLAKAGIGSPQGSGTPAVTAPVSNSPVANAPVVTAPSSPANIGAPATNLAANTAAGALNTVSNALGGAPSGAAPTSNSAPQTTITIPTILSGVNIPSAGGGSTQVLANISATQIQNIVLNSASNQNINQNTNVTLTIYNFQQWQQQLAQHALSAQLLNQLMSVPGFGH